MVRRCNDAAFNCFHRNGGQHSRRLLGLGLQALARALLSRGPAAASLVRALCRRVRHRRDQQQLLSFAQAPRPSTKWRDQAPPGFRYAVKANRFITHMKKLLDVDERLERSSASRGAWGPPRSDPLSTAAEPPQRPQRLDAFLGLLPRTSSMSSSSGTAAGTTRMSSPCSTATVPASSPTTSRV